MDGPSARGTAGTGAGGPLHAEVTVLEVGRYRFSWAALEPGVLPRFWGPALRGGLGHVLRRMVCVTRLPLCDGCLLRFRCAYPVLFQPFAPPDRAQGGRYARMPVPFVLRVPFGDRSPRLLRQGDAVAFELVLVGEANLHLPYYLLAVAELGRRGLGPQRLRFRLEEVAAWTPGGFVPVYRDGEGNLRTDVPPLALNELLVSREPVDARRLAVRFISPVRLDLEGDLVYPVEFWHLVRGLVERMRALVACYGGDALPRPEGAEGVRRAEDRTRWVDFSRYSTRQQTEMRLGGAVGTVIYEGEDLRPFWPLLAFGEWLGVGKLTSMGFGQMEVVRA